MASRFTLTASIQPFLIRTYSLSVSSPSRLRKSLPCPLWSSSFSFCLHNLHNSVTSSSIPHFSSCSSISAPSMAASAALDEIPQSNPLLQNFYFPPFDAVEAKHVRPGILTLLKTLEGDLEELERTVEPSWSKLVEPLEKITDRLNVVWGIVNHLKSVKDTADLRIAIEEVQPEKVKFQLRLGQSKPIYNAFKAIRESPEWNTLNDARKRIVESQIKEALLHGVTLEDDKRDNFNKIQQIPQFTMILLHHRSWKGYLINLMKMFWMQQRSSRS